MTTTFRTHDGRTLDQAASDLVQREVLCCMSSMVSTLAQGFGCIEARTGHHRDVLNLSEQAFELCAPVLDHEEAAREAGWECIDRGVLKETWRKQIGEDALGLPEYDYAVGAEDICIGNGIEPHEFEVYEHWAVSTWLAEKLQAAGERVDTDFAGLNVWARTTTGQAISIDAVIERITREMHAA